MWEGEAAMIETPGRFKVSADFHIANKNLSQQTSLLCTLLLHIPKDTVSKPVPETLCSGRGFCRFSSPLVTFLDDTLKCSCPASSKSFLMHHP